MGTASDGVVYSNMSAIQLHPIGLSFGLGRGEERKGRMCSKEPVCVPHFNLLFGHGYTLDSGSCTHAAAVLLIKRCEG